MQQYVRFIIFLLIESDQTDISYRKILNQPNSIS